jgi:hypothetical protein
MQQQSNNSGLSNIEYSEVEIPYSSKMVDLISGVNQLLELANSGKITIEEIIQFLVDLKRTGDWEQCNISKHLNTSPTTSNSNPNKYKGRTIMCSRDRLCTKAYSRFIQQNSIASLDTELFLYRFPGETISQGESLKRSIEYLKPYIRNFQKKLKNVKTWVDKYDDKYRAEVERSLSQEWPAQIL